MNMISGAFDWGADLISNFVSGVFGGENEITKAAEKIGERIWEYLHFSEPEKGKLADFSTFAPDMMQTFANGISGNAGLIINELTKLSDNMSAKAQDAGKRFLDGVQSFTEKLPGNVGNHLTATVTRVVEWGKNLKQKADSAASDMVSVIENKIRSLPDKMTDIGRNLVQGLWNGIQGMKDWVLSQISGFCDNIISGIMNSFEIHSPSRRTFYAGQMIDTGLAEGVEAYADDPTEAVRRMAANLLDEAAVIPERLEMQNQYQPPVVQTSGLESTISAQLGEILQAIRDGQVLVIDGNKLVGATADRMNSALGQIQLLAARRL